MKVLIDTLVFATFLASITSTSLAATPVTNNQEVFDSSRTEEVLSTKCWPDDDMDLTTREDHFSLDIDPTDPHDKDSFNVLEDIHFDDTHATRVCMKGAVLLIPGEQTQKNDFEVLITSKSSEQQLLDSLEIGVETGLLYIKRHPHPPPNDGTRKVTLQVDVNIAVRPGLVQKIPLGTKVTTRWLDTQIQTGLSLETKHISLSSTYGSINSQEAETFKAHNISLYSKYGPITGTWSLHESAAFETKYGNIDIELLPKKDAGDLSVISKYGTINVREPFDKVSQQHSNLTTNISSKSGIIHASLLHGSSTTIKLKDGSVSAALLPTFAGNNTITTECTSCELKFELLNPAEGESLHYTRSKHTIGDGAMHLSYPSKWTGEAEWLVKQGFAQVRGEDYELIERGFNHGKIQRRPLKGGHMEVEARNGFMELEMKA